MSAAVVNFITEFFEFKMGVFNPFLCFSPVDVSIVKSDKFINFNYALEVFDDALEVFDDALEVLVSLNF